MKKIKNTGLVFNKKKDPRAYVLGGGSLPEVVLKEDGQWDLWLPTAESQDINFETYACTVYGSLNAVEMLIKRITNFEQNFSDRFNFILAGIKPPGADPHDTLESIRERGVIDEELLPRTKTLAEYKKPNPMTPDLLEKGMEFPYEIKHEYLWRGNPTKLEKLNLIKNALRFSPVCVSVTAWHEKNGVFVDNGKPNNHWTLVFGYTSRGLKVFDSYDKHVKILSFDHNIQVAKRFHLEKNNRLPQISLIGKLIKVISELIAKMFAEPQVEPQVTTAQPIIAEEPPKYDWDTPVLARHSVRVICDEEGLTLEQKNLITAVISCESGFRVNAINGNKDGTTDYGICQYNSYWYIGKGKPIASIDEALNNPEKCVRVMIKQFKKGQLKDWICYRHGLYKKYL